MADAAPKTHWVIQILFGRFRTWGSVTWVHLIVLVVAVVVLTYLYLVLLKRRFAHYQEEINRIPRDQMPITKRDMSRKMYLLLIDELFRVNTIQSTPIEPEKNPNGGDPGWGESSSRVDNVHFATSIAKSYFVLEKTALSRRPGLWQREYRTVREYVAALRKAFPSLSARLCDDYIRSYERSVFGNHRFTYQEYSQFMRVVLEMVALINNQHAQMHDGDGDDEDDMEQYQIDEHTRDTEDELHDTPQPMLHRDSFSRQRSRDRPRTFTPRISTASSTNDTIHVTTASSPDASAATAATLVATSSAVTPT